MLSRLAITIVTALALTAAAAPTADAATSQESLFQDDAALLYQGNNRREKTLDELDRLGVDVIRGNFIWSHIAPGWNMKRKPDFDAADSFTYPPHHWERFDRLVQGAAARGIALQVTITGPAPAWGSDCKGSVTLRRTCRPDTREFGRFAIALARRYSGRHPGLPRVSRWSIWNEPNQAGWLYPQTEAVRRYRSISYAVIDALRKNGHAKDQILLGETAPLGRRFGPPAKLNKSPLEFWRGVLCIDSRGRRITTRSLGCHKKFKQLKVTGAAHHPYTRGGSGHPRSFIGPNDVTLAAIPRLTRVIDQARRYRRVPSRLPIYLTEYGFQTNPPDRYSGVSPTTQARWLNESDWIAYRNRRIRSVAQFVLRDERPLRSFQTGLRYKTGRAKPSLAAYRLPIWVTGGSVWGQARPGKRGDEVEIRYQPRPGATWRRLKTISITNSRGYFRIRTSRRAYRWRFKWKKHMSRAAQPAPR